MKRIKVELVVAWLVMLAACGGDGVRTPADASADASADAGSDSGVDAGSDSGADGSADAGSDGGVDASADAGSDSGVDASADAGSDSGVDASADAGSDGGVDASADAALDASADAGSDASTPTCITSFRCEAETAESECGVVTADGRRYPDLGAPYCTDRVSRAGCTCDLARCVSPAPLCAGTYIMRAREQLISGCNGVPGELSGTCSALWNVAETWPGAALISERHLLNVHMTFGWDEYQHVVVLTEPTVVRMRVEQSAWFADVSGVGNSGRSEVDWLELAAMP